MKYPHQISPQESEKYDKTFGTKIRVGLKKLGGGMMLWIMSGTFKVLLQNSCALESGENISTNLRNDNYNGRILNVILNQSPLPKPDFTRF